MKKLNIAFGNYLLSTERNKLVSEQNKQNVTDADIENFKEKTIDDHCKKIASCNNDEQFIELMAEGNETIEFFEE